LLLNIGGYTLVHGKKVLFLIVAARHHEAERLSLAVALAMAVAKAVAMVVAVALAVALAVAMAGKGCSGAPGSKCRAGGHDSSGYRQRCSPTLPSSPRSLKKKSNI